MVGLSSLVRPPSSAGETSLRAWAIHGSAASIVAGVSRTPGRISRAKARVLGNEALRCVSALSACSSVGPSSAIDRLRLDCSAASAPSVVLKLVTKPLSDSSLDESALVTLPVLSTRPERSCCSRPRNAWLTIDAFLSASGA